MPQPEPNLDAVLRIASLADRPPAEAVNFLGTVTDAAWDSRRADVLRHLASLADTIDRGAAAHGDITLLDYYLANVWNGIKFLSSPHSGGAWDWEAPEIEQETVCVRRALQSPGLLEQPVVRVCQIHTNLANCYSTTGRFVEAITAWNKALLIEPRFGMARGNRAVGLWTYARSVYDEGHALVMAREAWLSLDPSTLGALEPGAGDNLASVRRQIEEAVRDKVLQDPFNLEGFDLGSTDAERRYREWCLDRTLFLNPLNDIGPIRIAARDVLSCPSIVARIGEGPRFHDFFNQIKQEFCSARWLVYEASQEAPPHYSDRQVLLYNTLDYPSYGLATEKLKLAFRALYSLFDKISYFLNAYLDLGIPEKQVSFRGLWYNNQIRKKGIRTEFVARENWPLRGLYWLGKDLYEDNAGFREAMDPAAERLNDIRNHLEHKYLKLHSDLWGGPGSSSFTDGLAVSLGRDEFEEMSLHLLSMTRAASIYLSLGVHREERLRAASRDPNEITPPMFLDTWEDDWKS